MRRNQLTLSPRPLENHARPCLGEAICDRVHLGQLNRRRRDQLPVLHKLLEGSAVTHTDRYHWWCPLCWCEYVNDWWKK